MDQGDGALRRSICYRGMLGGPRSMGRVGQVFLDHLLDSGRYDVGFSPVGGDYMRPTWTDRYTSLIDRRPPGGFDQLVTFCPIIDQQMQGLARLVSPWVFYELATVPRPVVDLLNSHDFIYACSGFVRDVMNASGVRVPVGVLGHGYDETIYSLVERRAVAPLRFLCVAEFTPRKNLPFLIRCFEQAFAGAAEVELVIKVGVMGAGRLAELVTQPNIRIVSEELASDRELFALYARSHCFVLPTRAEGFGMPILEAMATGLPVIVTDYSGHLDFCSDENAFLIEVDELVPSDPACFPHIASEWAAPSADHLIHLLRTVAADYDAALRVGRKGWETVREEWTWRRQLSRSF